jgi:hypothetical protein
MIQVHERDKKSVISEIDKKPEELNSLYSKSFYSSNYYFSILS